MKLSWVIYSHQLVVKFYFILEMTFQKNFWNMILELILKIYQLRLIYEKYDSPEGSCYSTDFFATLIRFLFRKKSFFATLIKFLLRKKVFSGSCFFLLQSLNFLFLLLFWFATLFFLLLKLFCFNFSFLVFSSFIFATQFFLFQILFFVFV